MDPGLNQAAGLQRRNTAIPLNQTGEHMGFHTIVCIKSVIHSSSGNSYVRTPETTSLNYFDRPAIELGASLAKQHQGRLTVLTMGPPSSAYALYQAMAMGAHDAVLVSDPALKESDTFVTSLVLSTALKKAGPADLILFGTRSSDSDTGHVGPQTAQALDIPFLINVTSLEKKSTGFIATRTLDRFEEWYETTMPAAFSVSPASSGQSHTRLGDIEQTFESKSIVTWNLDHLGLQAAQTGLAGSPTKIVAMTARKKRKTCEFLQGSLEQQTALLTEKLLESGVIG